jgi:hypothetical protein
MISNRLLELAGLNPNMYLAESYVSEVVDLTGVDDLDDLAKRLMHCKKALAIANSLPDPADKKKWKSAAFVNLNKVRAALQRISKQMAAEQEPSAEL